MEYIFSFSSRNSAIRFCEAVAEYGGYAAYANTPLGGQGCGLSVKCRDYELCDGVLGRGYYPGLRAVYKLENDNYDVIYRAPN